MIILETRRLRIREFERADIAFIMELLNEPAWIKFISDKNVHNLEGARDFIDNKLRPSYKKNGFGLFLA